MSSPWPEIRRDVDDITWNLLNNKEKKFAKGHERSETLETRSAWLSVPEYIGRCGRGKFLSWNKYKNIRPDFSSQGKKKTKSIKSVRVGPKPKSVEYWLGLADKDTSSAEVKTASSSTSDESISTSGRSESSEKTESDG